MIARIFPTFAQVAVACFPVARCTVRGYSSKSGYCLTLSPPQPFAGPATYTGTGRTCYEALAAAVRLFHDSAHAYPGAAPLAAAGSYSPPRQPQPFPHDDEPQGWPETIRTEASTRATRARLTSLTAAMRRPSAEAPAPAESEAGTESEQEQQARYDEWAESTFGSHAERY